MWYPDTQDNDTELNDIQHKIISDFFRAAMTFRIKTLSRMTFRKCSFKILFSNKQKIILNFFLWCPDT